MTRAFLHLLGSSSHHPNVALGQLSKSVTNAATASFGSRKERKRRRRVYISRTTFGLQKIVSAVNVDFIQAVALWTTWESLT